MGHFSSRRSTAFDPELWKSLGRLVQPPLLAGGVRFVRNHDSVMNGNMGIHWCEDEPRDRDILGLAWAFTLALSGGICLVWKDDAELVPVQHGVKFRSIMESTYSPHYILWNHQLGLPPIVAVLRGNAGFALFNLSDTWMRKADICLKSDTEQPQLEGEYQELQFGFSVLIDSTQCLVKWGSAGRRGIEIGERTALFFVKKELLSHRGSNVSTVYHAFHEPFTKICQRFYQLSSIGFDAVQLSPAQASHPGGGWWHRYQPRSYRRIEGLGSIDDLKRLCWEARNHGLFVIADVVFNHAQVVGSCSEWRAAQHSQAKDQQMLERLDWACENLKREHYEEWNEMNGSHWDNQNRTRYWGCGEWSTFRPCDAVFREHEFHLLALLSCGVCGFRFDAAKHMEPDTVQHYMDFLHANSNDHFAYMEVLTQDASMQHAYSHLGASTDFAYTYFLHGVFANLPGCGRRTMVSGKFLVLALAFIVYMCMPVFDLHNFNVAYQKAKAKVCIDRSQIVLTTQQIRDSAAAAASHAGLHF